MSSEQPGQSSDQFQGQIDDTARTNEVDLTTIIQIAQQEQFALLSDKFNTLIENVGSALINKINSTTASVSPSNTLPESPSGDRQRGSSILPENPQGNRQAPPNIASMSENSIENRQPPAKRQKQQNEDEVEEQPDDILSLTAGSDLEDLLGDSEDEVYGMLDEVLDEGDMGPEIKPRLASAISNTWTKEINKEKFKNKLSGYKIPSNCKFLSTQK